jgi:hypothetical protein
MSAILGLQSEVQSPPMLAGVLVFVAQAALPDLTIITTTRMSSDRPIGTTHTTTIQIKGARQRMTQTFEVRGQPYRSGPSVVITQCDVHREIIVNEYGKIYRIMPLFDPQAFARARRAAKAQAPAPDSRPVTRTITIDAVDTGQRRTVGPLVASHVITRWKTEGQKSPHDGERLIDGWYVDLPVFDCQERPGVAVAFLSGPAEGRTEVRWLGKARTGYAIAETDRTTGTSGDMETVTGLVSISTADLDDRLFDTPAGYRPALPRFDGSFDLERPDTYWNRVSALWSLAAAWARQWWR